MTTYKSKRSYFEYPFTDKNKEKIQDIINNEFDKYLNHTANYLSKEDREHLRRLAVDQLSEFMSELSDEKVRWSLESNIITIKVQSHGPRINRQTIESKPDSVKSNYRFIQKSNKWECFFDKSKSLGIPYDEFRLEVYKHVYKAASTAAFYAIDSWFPAK